MQLCLLFTLLGCQACVTDYWAWHHASAVDGCSKIAYKTVE